jgi:LPXTG-motif cell wall-anchored protein
MFDTVVKDDFTECSVRLRNLAYANSKETPTEEQDSAVINVNKEKCNPPVTPQYSCDLLTATKIGSGREVKYTASASASGGATIKNYVYSFGDGSNDVTTSNTSVNHIYGKDGKYNARVTVMVIVGNSVKEVSGQNCQTTVEFKKEVTPSYSCDLLSLEKTGKSREVKLTVKASADGGAEIKRYVYSFGDGTDNLTTDKNVVLHTYAKDGTYAARVKVQVQVGDEVKEVESDKCAVPVTFTTPKPPVTPPTTPVTPGALPNTGAGNIIATFLAVSGVSTFAYYIVSRRFARF